MALRVLSAGPLTTIQDQGRFGFERFGVPVSGAMDWFALRAANTLTGNSENAAGLEFTLQAPVLQCEEECLLALCGQGFTMQIGGREVGSWRAAYARPGEIVQFSSQGSPGWGFLAAAGGIEVPLVMGSRATYLRGGFGGLEGRTLRDGDLLPLGPSPGAGFQQLAGRALPRKLRPPYAESPLVPIVPGPQAEVFGSAGLDALLNGEYAVRSDSDRMGYRLSGPAIPRRVESELLSEGIANGSIQVPPDGQPIVLLADRPTTGGYHKIATVARVGLPLLAQAAPGVGRVRFEAVTVAEAHARLREWIERLETGIK
jgi:antagonist of KipI